MADPLLGSFSAFEFSFGAVITCSILMGLFYFAGIFLALRIVVFFHYDLINAHLLFARNLAVGNLPSLVEVSSSSNG